MVGFVGLNEPNATTSKLRMMICSWAKIPTLVEILQYCTNFVVVADEAHAMQTYTSKRTKSVLDICKHSACQGVLLSTGNLHV